MEDAMGDYFKPWRRKAGCGLLLVALVMLTAWMRSQHVSDSRAVTVGSKTYILESAHGRFRIAEVTLLTTMNTPMMAQFRDVQRIGYLPPTVVAAVLSGILLLWPMRGRPSLLLADR
jgi:hypothetical protein